MPTPKTRDRNFVGLAITGIGLASFALLVPMTFEYGATNYRLQLLISGVLTLAQLATLVWLYRSSIGQDEKPRLAFWLGVPATFIYAFMSLLALAGLTR